MTWDAMISTEPKWRVERARAGRGWIAIDPGGFGKLFRTWATAYAFARSRAYRDRRADQVWNDRDRAEADRARA